MQDRVDGGAGKRLRQLAHEERVLVCLVHEPEQGEREEEQRYEREEREVRDHRGEMRAPVGEELGENPPHWPPVCSAPWTQPRRSPT